MDLENAVECGVCSKFCSIVWFRYCTNKTSEINKIPFLWDSTSGPTIKDQMISPQLLFVGCIFAKSNAVP